MAPFLIYMFIIVRKYEKSMKSYFTQYDIIFVEQRSSYEDFIIGR